MNGGFLADTGATGFGARKLVSILAIRRRRKDLCFDQLDEAQARTILPHLD